MKKRIAILGATGSIGLQTVDVIVNHPELFECVALSVGHQINKLREILTQLTPEYVCVIEQSDYEVLKEEYPNIHFVYGDEGLMTIATLDNVDIVLNGIVGFAGLRPTIAAIEAKKDIGLANKETLVVAGHIITELVKKHGVQLLPVDSEHSAIFQCLNGEHHGEISRLIITASGGSFRDKTREELVNVTKADALKHPNWDMGAKVTIENGMVDIINRNFRIAIIHCKSLHFLSLHFLAYKSGNSPAIFAE